MKLKTLFLAAASLIFTFAANAQVVVSSMTDADQATYFKSYDGVNVSLAGTYEANGDYYYGRMDKTDNSAYVAITSDKVISEVRILVTGNGNDKKCLPGLIGFAEVAETPDFKKADYAVAADSARVATKSHADAKWFTFDLSGKNLKAVYISKQWKNVVVGDAAKASFPASDAQSFFAYGFAVAVEGETLPEIPVEPVDTVPQDTTPATPSTNVVLYEALFSNGAKGFIKQPVDSTQTPGTVTVPFMGEKPSLVSGLNEEKKAVQVSVEGDKVVVVNGEARAEYELSFVEYSVAPLEVGAAPYTFTGKEIGTWIASVYGWNEARGIKFAKDVEEASNRRISEGKDRVYFFLPAADSVRLESGEAQNRPVVITVNGVTSEVARTAKTGEFITIALPNVPAMVAIESNGNSGDGGFVSIQLLKAGEAPQPAEPKVTKFVIAGVNATIDQEAKTITAEVPFGTDVEAALDDALFEDNREDLEAVLDAQALTLTLGELVYTLNITIGAEPEPDVVLYEAIFSNGAKGFIDNKNGANTVEVPFIGEVPTFVSGRIENGEATVALEGDDKIVVTNGDAKAEYALSFKEYSAAPLEVDAEAYTFTGEEIGTWIASVNGWDAKKGIKFAKNVEEEGNRRISEGKDRVYFFLPAADRVQLVSGEGQNRSVTITVNGVASDVNKTAKNGEAITIALGNVPSLLAIESNGTNGDGGFTSIRLLSQDTTTQPVDTIPTDTTIVEPEGTHVIIADYANEIGTFEAVGNCSVDSKRGMKFSSQFQNGKNYYAVTPAEVENFATGDTIDITFITTSSVKVDIYDNNNELLLTSDPGQGSSTEAKQLMVLPKPAKQLFIARNGGSSLYIPSFKVYAIAERDTVPAQPVDTVPVDTIPVDTIPVDTIPTDTTIVEPVGAHEIIADFAGNVGTFTPVGTCVVDKEAMKFANSFNDGSNYFEVAPDKYETFVKGDTINITRYLGSDAAGKFAQIVIYNDANEEVFRTDSLAETKEPASQMFVLEGPTTVLRLGRAGNTGVFVPDFVVWANPQRTPTAITMAEIGATVIVNNSTLNVNAENAATIQVYTVDGRLVDNRFTTNYSRTLSTGVYVVRVNDSVVKTIVR